SSHDSNMKKPQLHPVRPLSICNFLIIGTVVRKDVFLRLGGFSDLPILEDWELWRRFEFDGAKHYPVPKAVYHATITPGSRNQNEELATKVANQIRRMKKKRPIR